MPARFVFLLCGFCFSAALSAGCLYRELWLYAGIDFMTACLWYWLMDGEFRESVKRAQSGYE